MHIDDTIDQCAAFGFTRAIRFVTRVDTLRSQAESRNGDVDRALLSFTAPYNNISNAGMDEVERMFYVCRGRLFTFNFEDPKGSQVTNELFGVGDGETSIFQLSRLFQAAGGTVTYSSTIALPIDPVILVAGSPSFPDVDLEFGTVDFGSSPPEIGEALTWSGGYNRKVRFDQDEIQFSLDNIRDGGFAHNGTLTLVEVDE